MGSLVSIEDAIIIFCQRFMSDAMVKFASIITLAGEEIFLIAIVGLFYWSLNKELGKKLVIYVSFVYACYPFIKSLVKRPRPYMLNRDIKCLKPVNKEGDIYDIVSQEYSFPSGHACNSISAYGPLIKRSKSTLLKIAIYILILLAGVSRFVLGVHYPSDVIVGWIFACLCIALYNVMEKKLGRNRTFILIDIVAVLGFFICTTNDFYSAYGMLLGSTFGIMFEEKNVKFEGTRKPLSCILRTVGGGAIFFGLNTLLKMPFTKEFLNSGTTPAFLVRTVRYGIIVFILIGLYPMCFKLFGKKK